MQLMLVAPHLHQVIQEVSFIIDFPFLFLFFFNLYRLQHLPKRILRQQGHLQCKKTFLKRSLAKSKRSCWQCRLLSLTFIWLFRPDNHEFRKSYCDSAGSYHEHLSSNVWPDGTSLWEIDIVEYAMERLVGGISSPPHLAASSNVWPDSSCL